MLQPKSTTKLIAWILVFQCIGFLLGLVTQAHMHPWYESLYKSSLTPPGLVFAIVWPVLYAILALIAWMISNHSKKPGYRALYFLFATQMLMNWSWTLFFFQLHWLKFSSIWLIVLTIITLVLMFKANKSVKIISILLAPYALWLIFASYLNVVIAVMN